MADVGTVNAIDQLYIFTKAGTVVGNQNWSEVSISSTTTTNSGGGYVHMGTGHMAPTRSTTTVSSNTTEQLRLFVQDDDGGREFEATFSDPGFGVRDGHRVTVVYAGDQASQAGYPMALINHSTGNNKIFNKRAEWIIKRLNTGIGCALLAGIPIAGAYLIGTNTAGPVLVLAVTTGGWLFWNHLEKNRLAKAIVAAVTRETQHAMKADSADSEFIAPTIPR